MVDKKDVIVGAQEKLRIAQQMKDFEKGIVSKKDGPAPSQTAPMVVVFLLAVLLAYSLTKEVLPNIGGLHVDFLSSDFNNLLFGAQGPSLSSSKDGNILILSVIRGAFYFAFGGIIPLLTLIWMRLVGKTTMSPYIVCWGIILGLPAVILGIAYIAVPFVKSLIG